jgi:competence protein ComEC
MKMEPLPLFTSSKEVLVFALGVFLLLLLSIGFEYRDYRRLSRFDDAEIKATVVRQYAKSKAGRSYQVLKLRSREGAPFFMTASAALRDLSGYEVTVWLRTDRLSFFEYLKGFFAHGYIGAVSPRKRPAFRAADMIASQHTDRRIGRLFASLFAATPVGQETRAQISALGIGHLLAISGFHIGLLSALLYWLMRFPYRGLQSRRFPWRNGKRDLFFLTAAVMLGYVWFLQMTPSVLRAYAMMLIGFLFYDRGIRVLSFQSLLMTVSLLVALWPRLFFSMGFWLSVAGVFYVFAFLQRFEARGSVFKFVGMHVWVYLMMLPISLALFGTFSSLHPLSVLWTMLFILFYPLALLLHLVGLGGVLDGMMNALLYLPMTQVRIETVYGVLAGWVGLSLLAFKSETVKRLLPYLAVAVFVSAVYQVA